MTETEFRRRVTEAINSFPSNLRDGIGGAIPTAEMVDHIMAGVFGPSRADFERMSAGEVNAFLESIGARQRVVEEDDAVPNDRR